MKFSDISADQWEQLQPYLDTCVLPLTLLQGDETPAETTSALERLRDLLDLIEVPFKGRTVTYPAVQYMLDESSLESSIDQICARLKSSTFTYVIVVMASKLSSFEPENADLLISSDDEQDIRVQIQELWSGQANS